MTYRRLDLVIAASALLCLPCGCVQEVSAPDTAPDPAWASPAIIASAEASPATRTCIETAFTGSTSWVAVLWTPSDELGVFTESEQNIRYTKYNTTDNEEVAAFVASETVSGTPAYAYYPYREDAGTDVTALNGNIPEIQTMDPAAGTLPGDWKYGVYRERTSEGVEFRFTHLFSPIRIVIDGSDTGVSGDLLEGIDFTVTRGGEAVPVCGSFTFSATDGSYTLGTTSNSMTLDWTTNPAMGASVEAYGTMFPEVKAGDILSFEVLTSSHRATFSVAAKVDFEPNHLYTFPLKLSRFASDPDAYGFELSARPAMSAFGFEVADNPGSLLDNRLVWSSSDEPQFEAVSSYAATVSGSAVSLMIPYLYDFTLIPTFTVGEGCTVTSGGVTVVSGETEVDFSEPVTFTVTSASGESRDYVVSVTNTGLPVVVLKQSGSGDFEEDYSGGVNIGSTNIGGTLVNRFVDFMIRGKGTDWVSDDCMTVYNADGSVDLATTACGARLRGNTSQAYPKKPFAIKMASKVPVLGMPAHKRWVLLANWLDHSMIRNTVAFDIAHAVEDAWRQSGGTIGEGIPWNVHGQNVELVFVESDGTGHHVGNYYLCEQIKIDGNRLDIRDTYEDVIEGNASPALADCGYLLEFDSKDDTDPYFETGNGIRVKFKDDAIGGTDLFSQVQSIVQEIEDLLDDGSYAAAYERLDINSVADQWLIWELTMNREYGDPGSVYMYMDGDGKLCAGPVWDFDRGTFQNTANASAQGNTDRVKPYGEWMCWRSAETYIWYKQLIKDATFQATVQERWAVMYPYLQDIPEKIRGYGETLAVSFGVDSAMWPTDADAVHAYKSGFSDWSGDEEIGDWDELIDNFVEVYEARLSGMNSLITGGRFTE